MVLISTEKKALRQSTTQKTKALVSKEKERDVKTKMMKEIAAKRNVSDVRRLTQEELLKEAKITEKINLQSLGELCYCTLLLKILHDIVCN